MTNEKSRFCRGQAILIACLFALCVKVSAELSFVDGVGIDRLLLPNEPAIMQPRMQDSSGKASFVSVKGDYLLAIDEVRMVDDTLAQTIHLDNRAASVTAGHRKKNSGYCMSFTTDNTDGWYDKRSSRMRETLLSEVRSFAGGAYWFFGTTMLTGEVTGNVVQGSKKPAGALYWRHPSLFAASPFLDGKLAAKRTIGNGSITLSYVNSSPKPLTLSVFNRKGSARRDFAVAADCNTFTAATDLLAGGRAYSGNITLSLFGDNSSTADFQHAYPVALTGYSFGGGLSMQNTRMPMQPGCTFDIREGRLDAQGATSAGEQFLTSENGRIIRLNGAVNTKVGRRTSVALVYSAISASVEKGRLWMFPFTDWMVLLDIPDAVRVNSSTIDISEGGLHVQREFRVGRAQQVTADVKVTGCSLRGRFRTDELHRYLEVLPVIKNDQLNEFDDKYIIGKAGVSWQCPVAGNDCCLKFSQLIPFKLSNNVPESTGNDEPENPPRKTTKRIWGGLHLSMSVTRQW